MDISSLLMISIKVGNNENWSKDHTYAYYGGFITYNIGDTIYAIKESTAIEKLLGLYGFTKNENAFGETINHEDFERYLINEGPTGTNVRKLVAYLYDKDFREKWDRLTDPKQLQAFLEELVQYSPYFNPTGLNFLDTEWGKWTLSEYEMHKVNYTGTNQVQKRK